MNSISSTEKRKEMGDDKEKWVIDSSVDHKGRIPLRASTGVWKASLFIIAIEFSERLSYFGLSANLIIYLTKVLHEELKTSVKNVNYWTGVTTIMPLIGAFVADAYLGRFSTVLISSIIYVLGLVLLTMSQLIPGLKPCSLETCHKSLRLHKIIFFIALYLISIGTGGHKPSLESFGADQFDDNHPKERKMKMSYFNWWNFGLCCGLLFGVTFVAYIQDNVSWVISSIILTLVMCMSLVIFLVGRPFYRYQAPRGSPFAPMLQVVVAAIVKRNLVPPSNVEELFEVPLSQKNEKRFLCHTSSLRFLDKAAIIQHKNDESAFTREKLNPWRLATVTQVEELKLIISMIPIWLTSVPFGICTAQASTLYIKQGSLMNRKIVNNFEIPSTSIYGFAALSMILSVSFYDRMLVPLVRRSTKNDRGITILQRMGIGMVLVILLMIVSAMVERKRLLLEAQGITISVFWLLPQFMILGLSDGFTLVGLQEFFYDQVPDGMRSLGIALYLSVLAIASFLNSILITVVDKITKRRGSEGWFAGDLNKSRVDYFYWLLCGIMTVDVFVYFFVAAKYSYKNVQIMEKVDEDDDENQV